MFGHTSPADRFRELFEPYKIAESLAVSMQKILKVLGLNFFGVTTQLG